MKGLNKATKIITRILEIAHWVAAGFMVAIAVCSVAAPQWLGSLMDLNGLENESAITVYGFEVNLVNSAGVLDRRVLLLFAIGAFVLCALVAMVFRNIRLIIQKAEETTPFQKDNVRMVREIGIFSIAIPVVGLLMSVVIRLVGGVEANELSVNLDGFVMGIVVLCLTQFFAYGAELEKDVGGLV